MRPPPAGSSARRLLHPRPAAALYAETSPQGSCSGSRASSSCSPAVASTWRQFRSLVGTQAALGASMRMRRRSRREPRSRAQLGLERCQALRSRCGGVDSPAWLSVVVDDLDVAAVGAVDRARRARSAARVSVGISLTERPAAPPPDGSDVWPVETGEKFLGVGVDSLGGRPITAVRED